MACKISMRVLSERLLFFLNHHFQNIDTMLQIVEKNINNELKPEEHKSRNSKIIII